MIGKHAGTWRRVGASVVLAATAAVVFAAGGSLDTGFGTGGVVTVAVNQGQVNEVVAQTDGKVVVCGWESTGRVNELGQGINEAQVRRFAANGALDAAYGTGGLVRLFGTWGGIVWDHALDASGRTVAGGESAIRSVAGKGRKQVISYTKTATVVRLNTNGSLDTTFGSGGIVQTTISGSTGSSVGQVMIQPDGRIVVAGIAMFLDSSVIGGTDVQPFVARYLASGATDTSFGTGGITVDASYTGQNTSTMYGAALQSTGDIVVGVSRFPNLWAVIRFTPAGVIDTGFAAISGPDTIWGVSVDRLDRIVVTGQTPSVSAVYDVRAARYLPNGAADASFGTGGGVTITGNYNQQARTRARFQSDDKMVFSVGLRPTTVAHLVASTIRLTDAGALDTTYGTGGWGAIVDLVTTSDSHGNGIGIAPDGGILLGGNCGGNWFVARYARD